MKTKLLALLIVLTTLLSTGCTTVDKPIDRDSLPSAAISQGSGKLDAASSQPSSDPAPSSEALPPEPDEPDRTFFLAELTDVTGAPHGNPLYLSLRLPEAWAMGKGELYLEGNSDPAAKLLPAVWDSDSKAMEAMAARHSGAANVVDVTIGGYTGRYYHLQNEVTRDGVTGIDNEIIYYLDVGDALVSFAFYPLFGAGGIGTQREAFEVVLSSLRHQNDTSAQALVAAVNGMIDQYKAGTVDTKTGAPGASGPYFNKMPEGMTFPAVASVADLKSVWPIRGHEHQLLVELSCSDGYIIQPRINVVEGYKISTVTFYKAK